MAHLTTQRDGNLFRVTLDDGKANVLGTKMLQALRSAFESGKDADALLLGGREKIFCGGLDLNEVIPLGTDAFLAFLDEFHATFRALYAFDRPVVACARGSAVAGGAILFCTADLRLAAKDQGRIGVNEARLGVPFPVSAQEIVAHALPNAARALVLGELFTKEQAVAQGFVHQLYDPDTLAEATEEHLEDVARVSSSAAAAIKTALRKDRLARMDAEKDASHRAFVAAWTSDATQGRLRAIVAQMKKR
jgi:enoyl-CoA hydratase